MAEVNCPLYCDKCIHQEYAGEVMVGADCTGGGPEPSYNCRKDRNMTFYYFRDHLRCPDFDDGEEFY